MKQSLHILSLLLMVSVFWAGPVFADDEKPRIRKFYEYSGNYGEQVSSLKEAFKKRYGYALIDGEKDWTPREIERIGEALKGLPEHFYRLKGFEGFLRMAQIDLGPNAKGGEDVPAGTFPSFNNLHNVQTGKYVLRVGEGPLRIEIYNPIFYEDKGLLSEIVKHEMGHVFDMTHGFLSMTDEWISISGFKVFNLPPLDARPDADFIYTLVDEAEQANYSPVSSRQLPTYSRANIQEDFANSVSAYIHYPYFFLTHPERYNYLKVHVFDGKEYFKSNNSAQNFESLVAGEFEKAIQSINWKRAKDIAVEVNRSHYPSLDKKLADILSHKLSESNPGADDIFIAKTSCYLKDPSALSIRQSLARQKRITSDELFKEIRCKQMGRDNFEKNMAKWPPMGLYFYRDKSKADFLKFMDPVIPVAESRNFSTAYFWKLFIEGSKQPFAQGSMAAENKNAGSSLIGLQASALQKFQWPENGNVILELRAKRIHRKNLNSLDSDPARIRFKPFEWFPYIGPEKPGIFVRFPLALSYLDRP